MSSLLLERPKEAIDSFDQATKFKQDFHEAWYNRGITLLNLGRLDQAIASYNKALEFKPNYADAFYNKACSYALQGNVEQTFEAASWLQKWPNPLEISPPLLSSSLDRGEAAVIGSIPILQG